MGRTRSAPVAASGAEQEAIAEIEEAFIVTKQALRKLRSDGDPDLGGNGVAMLRLVERRAPVRVSDVAACFGLAISTVSRQLEPLVQGELVEVVADAGDQRVHRISLTTAGAAALRRARKRQIQRCAELLDEETRRELPELARLLTRFAHALHDADEPVPGSPERSRRAEAAAR